MILMYIYSLLVLCQHSLLVLEQEACRKKKKRRRSRQVYPTSRRVADSLARKRAGTGWNLAMAFALETGP